MDPGLYPDFIPSDLSYWSPFGALRYDCFFPVNELTSKHAAEGDGPWGQRPAPLHQEKGRVPRGDSELR